MEIIEKLKVLDLPEILAENFAQTIALIDIDEALQTKALLANYNVTLSKGSELKFYAYDSIELQKVLARLQYCRDFHKSVIDSNGQVEDFVFDSREWDKNFPGVDLTSIIPDVKRDEIVLSEPMITTLNSDIQPDLNDVTYEQYSSLSSLLRNVVEATPGLPIEMDKVNDNLIKLISSNSGYSYRDLLLGALIYGQNRSAEEVATITAAIDGVLASLDQGGSLKI